MKNTRQNNYKQNYACLDMDKRGQVTIFVVIAVVIVGLILYLFVFGGLPKVFQQGEFTPEGFLKTCIADDLKKDIALLGNNGGYEKPGATVMYNGEAYTYLCYTSEYYKTCTIQQPFIKSNFEKELKRMLTPKAEACAASLAEAYRTAGYGVVSRGAPKANVSVAPEGINADFFVNLAVTKQGSTQQIDKVSINSDSRMYDLMYLAGSMVDYEAVYGDSETIMYMQYYPDLKVEKIRRDEGSKIYILSNTVTKEQFKFAVRSLAWPAGYGFE